MGRARTARCVPFDAGRLLLLLLCLAPGACTKGSFGKHRQLCSAPETLSAVTSSIAALTHSTPDPNSQPLTPAELGTFASLGNVETEPFAMGGAVLTCHADFSLADTGSARFIPPPADLTAVDGRPGVVRVRYTVPIDGSGNTGSVTLNFARSLAAFVSEQFWFNGHRASGGEPRA